MKRGGISFLVLLGAAAARTTCAFPLGSGASQLSSPRLQILTNGGKVCPIDRRALQLRGGSIKPPFATLLFMVMTNTRRNVLSGMVLSIPLLAEVYSRVGSVGFRTKFPNEPFEDPVSGWDDVEDVTLVFHGAGGQDQYTDELMTNSGKNSRGKQSYAAIIDWSESSGNILQASFNGQRVGRETASRLLAKCGNKSLKSVHVIGISVGAFAADSCVTEMKEGLGDRKDGVHLQLTLLDPFEQRGILGSGYGNKKFGKSADYAQQFLNTDDPVPSTNTPLSNCACIDVTALRPPEIFGHDWPLVYYGRSGTLGLVPSGHRRRAGTVVVADK